MVSLVAWYAGLGVVQAALAVWVILTQPRRALNWAVGGFLLLWAGSGVLFQMMREATDPTTYLLYNRVASYYEAPTFFLILLIMDQLMMARPRPWPWRVGLGLSGIAVALFWALYATQPLVDPGMLRVHPLGSRVGSAALAPELNAFANVASQVAIVLLASRAAVDDGRSALHRRQAALVGLAFALLVVHAGSVVIAPLGRGHLPSASALLRTATALAGLAGVIHAVPRLAQAFPGRAAMGVRAPIVLALALGFIAESPPYSFRPFGVRVIVLSTFTMVLAVAILRYGLARRGEESRERVLVPPGAMLGISAAVLFMAAFWSTVPHGWLLFGGAMLVMMAPLVLLVAPLRQPPAGVSGRAPSFPHDPEAPEGRGMERALEDLPAERDHAAMETMASGHPGPRAGGVFLGRYRILKPLGRGAFGEVWLARDSRSGRDVVLKRLGGRERRDAHALRRIQGEARTAAAVRHPHIVAVHGVETQGEETFLVMEHLEGGSLAEALRKRGRLSEAEVLGVGLDVLSALKALHARGIVHRDVKPSNILLDARGRAKLGDFTIARELVSGDTIGPGGARGPVGTFGYMPPEQARGRTAGPPADLYALAATLYEALSGAPLLRLEGLSHQEAVSRTVQQPLPPPLPAASGALGAVLARALMASPDERFPDAGSMQEALQDITRGSEATPAGTPGGSGQRPRHHPA